MVWMEYLEMIPSSINRPQNIVCTRSGLIFKNKCSVSVRLLLNVCRSLFILSAEKIYSSRFIQSKCTNKDRTARILPPVTARF